LLDDSEGYRLVKLARSAVEYYLTNGKMIEMDGSIRERYSKKAGVFVTINKYIAGNEELRGCIGYPLATRDLYSALVEAAVSSAVRDPRFRPLSRDELNSVIFEVSVLTEPVLLEADDAREYKSMIKVGKHGLIIVWRYGSGLLLPQVAVEYGWDEERFLCEACMKANALPDCWLYEDTKVYVFEAIIFKEVEPNGSVVRVVL
jgi:uncharacterized protein (TIGR00296 family)